MRLLLDTHTFLWWITDAPRLSAEARAAVASPSNAVSISAATVWELAIKRASGKLEVDVDLGEQIELSGFSALPITIEHGLAAGALPPHHGDPFDRMLIAQAKAEGLTIVTRDRDFEPYGVEILRA